MTAPRMYRKRPLFVQAQQWEPGDPLASGRLIGWLSALNVDFHVVGGMGSKAELMIVTLEGGMKAIPGDWIIRGIAGEFYPCKPDIFAATYEPVAP